MADKKVLRQSDIIDLSTDIKKKLIADNNQSLAERHKKSKSINFNGLKRESDIQVAEKINNQVILESTPTLDRAIQLLTSLIVCPIGGTDVSLNYALDGVNLSPSVKQAGDKLIPIIAKHFDTVVKLPNKLSDMVSKALGTDGVVVTAFIPNTQINNIFETAGIEAANAKLLETVDELDFVKDSSFSITEDIGVLIIPDNKRRLTNNKIALEAEAKGNKDAKLLNGILQKRRIYKENPSLKLETTEVKSDTLYSLIKNIPAEAVRPIIHKSQPDTPYQYVILLDNNYSPIEVDEEIDFDKDLSEMTNDDESNEERVQLIANNFTTKDKNKKNVRNLETLYQQFEDAFEESVIDSVLSGTYNEKFTLKDNKVMADIMFRRLLRGQKTRILVVPEYQINYFCLDTDRYGVGRSLISKTKVLSSILMTLFYSGFLGALDANIPRRKVNIDFDSDDIDPSKTFEEIIHEQVTNKAGGSIGNLFRNKTPSNLLRKLQQMGVEYELNNLEGTELPNMNVNLEHFKRDRPALDTDFKDMVSKLLTMQVGFDHQTVDSSFSPEFYSSQVIRTNELTARLVSTKRVIVNSKVTDLVIKQTLHTPELLKEMETALGSSTNKEELISEVMASLEVKLPHNSSMGIGGKLEVINDMEDIAIKISEYAVPENYSEGVDGIGRDHLDGLREVVKAELMREFLRDNTNFKNILARVSSGEDLKAIIDSEYGRRSDVLKVLVGNASKLNMSSIKADAKFDKDEQKARDKLNTGEPEAALPNENTISEEEPNTDVPEEPTDDGDDPEINIDVPEL